MASLQIAPAPGAVFSRWKTLLFPDGAPTETLQGTLSRVVARAREEEARRIGRELHDDAGQLIASVSLALDEARRSPPERAAPALDEARRMLAVLEEQLRRLARELRPPALDDLGLGPAVAYLAEGVSARTGVHVTVGGSAGRRLPPEIEAAAYRIVQEAIANAVRHARPARIEVRLRASSRRLVVTVRDDGQGFDPRAVLGGRGPRGLGLPCILERLGSLGGSLRIRSSPARGAELRATIPLEGGRWAAGSSSPTTTRSSARE